jgi:hypothetical protein
MCAADLGTPTDALRRVLAESGKAATRSIRKVSGPCPRARIWRRRSSFRSKMAGFADIW